MLLISWFPLLSQGGDLLWSVRRQVTQPGCLKKATCLKNWGPAQTIVSPMLVDTRCIVLAR